MMHLQLHIYIYDMYVLCMHAYWYIQNQIPSRTNTDKGHRFQEQNELHYSDCDAPAA